MRELFELLCWSAMASHDDGEKNGEKKNQCYVEKKVGYVEQRMMDNNALGYEIVRHIMMMIYEYLEKGDVTYPLRQG